MIRSDFVMVVAGRFFSVLVAVAGLRIMTSLLDPEDYGKWVLLVAFQSFCALLLINPVDQHIFRFTHKWWDEGTLLQNFRKYNIYICAVSILVTVVVALWWSLNNPGENKLTSGLAAGLGVGFLVYVSTWSTTLLFSLSMLGFRLESISWTLASAIFGLICSTLFTYYYAHAFSWMFGQVFGSAVGAYCAWKVLRSQVPSITPRFFVKSFGEFLDFGTVRSFCLPLAAATGLMWLQNTGYRFWVGESWGVGELGILVIGLGISAQLTAIVESLAMQFLYPYFARRISDAVTNSQTSAALGDLMNVLAPVYAIWAGFNAAFAAVLLHLLTDSRYHSAIPFVLFGVVIEFSRCIANLWSNTGRAIKQTGGLILPYGVGASVVGIGSIVIARTNGNLEVLAALLVFAGLATSLTMMIQMQKRLAISIHVPRLAMGIAVMFGGFVIATMVPIEAGSTFRSLVALLIGGCVSGGMIAAVLWHNPALYRLLSAPLRMNPR